MFKKIKFYGTILYYIYWRLALVTNKILFRAMAFSFFLLPLRIRKKAKANIVRGWKYICDESNGTALNSAFGSIRMFFLVHAVVMNILLIKIGSDFHIKDLYVIIALALVWLFCLSIWDKVVYKEKKRMALFELCKKMSTKWHKSRMILVFLYSLIMTLFACFGSLYLLKSM